MAGLCVRHLIYQDGREPKWVPGGFVFWGLIGVPVRQGRPETSINNLRLGEVVETASQNEERREPICSTPIDNFATIKYHTVFFEPKVVLRFRDKVNQGTGMTDSNRVGPSEVHLPPPPATVTRFYGNLEFAREVVRDRKLAFVHVSKLNDPFDPYYDFLTDFDEKYARLRQWVKTNKTRAELRNFRTKMPFQSWTTIVSEIRAMHIELRRTSFIVSTSTIYQGRHPSQNFYMWGHYGCGHRGVALEFNTGSLSRDVLNHNGSLGNPPPPGNNPWANMLYREAPERVTAADIFEYLFCDPALEDQTQLAKHLNSAIQIKSKVWEPEQEWRLMWKTDNTPPEVYKMPISTDTVTKVYIGLKVSKADTTAIAQETRASFPNANIFRATERKGEFTLDYVPLINSHGA